MEHASPSQSHSSSLGIANTFLSRYAILAAVRLYKCIHPSSGFVLYLSKHLCVKYGSFVSLSEAFALQFVREHTSIPVPKVHCAFIHNGRTYILMDRVNGHRLAHRWSSRSLESKRKILAQLKEMLAELRSLPPPSTSISNVNGGPLFDCRFPGTSKTIGPFESIHDFHLFLRNDLEIHPNQIPEVNRMITLQDQPWPMPVFTHADLSSINILVRGDEVVGIVDWESSGWYPSYWEYSMASFVHPWLAFWKDEVPHFLDATSDEVEMEQTRLRYFGDV